VPEVQGQGGTASGEGLPAGIIPRWLRASHDKQGVSICVLVSLPLPITPSGFNHGGPTLVTLSNLNPLTRAPPLNTIVGLSFQFLNTS
jgi:hypothetical protein